jgi:23S rRNA pseudouridine955/2504/2580 synthase
VTEARTFTVADDDDGIRLDRWFKRHMPEVSFNLVSRWARTGQLRLAGMRAVPGDRIEAGQEIRIPPAEATTARPARAQPKREALTVEEQEFVRDMVIYEDAHAFFLI